MSLSDPSRRFRLSSGLLVAICVLSALALIYFAWPVYRAFLPLEIQHGDSWNSYQADALRAGQPLYQLNYFVTNNYPPLSFYLLNALSAAADVDVLYVGRALSLAATVATAGAVWICVRRLGGSRPAATLGAVWWFASMARWFSLWLGMNDPHLVALAMMTWGLAFALGPPRRGRVELAIVSMAIAGFYKHSLVAIPATTLCWFTLRDRRLGLRATVIGIGTVATGLAVCGMMFGEAFFHDMLLPRHYSIENLGTIGRVQAIAPALIIVGVWAAYRRQIDSSRFVLLFAAITIVSYVGQLSADGVSDNAMFELNVATAIGIGCAFDDLVAIPILQRWGLERSQTVVVWILIARLLLSQRMSPYLVLTSTDFRTSLNERVSIMKAESAGIAAIPGQVACDVAMACRFAGKPFVYDPFVVHEYIVTSTVSERDVAERVARLGIRIVAINRRVLVDDLK